MERNKITPKKVRELVHDVFGVDIRSKSRHGWNMAALKAYVILARKYTPDPLQEIGAEIGRGHSNVIHHLKGSDFYRLNYPDHIGKFKKADAALEAMRMAAVSVDTNALMAIRGMQRLIEQ